MGTELEKPPVLLPTRQLGRDGPSVTALGYGAMGLSAFYGPTLPDEERLSFLSELYKRGELHWDSADLYSDSEDLLGKWFKANPNKREHVFLATKFGGVVKEDGSFSVDSSPEYAKKACAKSLQRLGLKHIDLYYCHRVDGKTPIEKTVQAMAELKEAGLIKYLGLSEVSAETLRRAHKISKISAVQIEYSPFTLDIEDPKIDVLRTARELGIAVVAYSPIGRGMLGGRYRSPADFKEGDSRKFFDRFSEENFPKNLELVDKIATIAKNKGATPAQLTLAWLMAQGDDIIPIPGTTKIARVDENLGALKIKLTPEEEKEIRDACEKAEVRGDRYPSAMASQLFADTPPLN